MGGGGEGTWTRRTERESCADRDRRRTGRARLMRPIGAWPEPQTSCSGALSRVRLVFRRGEASSATVSCWPSRPANRWLAVRSARHRRANCRLRGHGPARGRARPSAAAPRRLSLLPTFRAPEPRSTPPAPIRPMCHIGARTSRCQPALPGSACARRYLMTSEARVAVERRREIALRHQHVADPVMRHRQITLPRGVVGSRRELFGEIPC